MQPILRPILAAAGLLLLNVISCRPDNYRNNPYTPIELTTKSAEFMQEGNRFAFRFIEKVNTSEKGDYLISPLSMQFLLGMILNGAQGQTAEEICDVLGYGAGQTDAVNDFCKTMLDRLPGMDKKTTLSIASAIYVDEGWPLKDGYKQTVGKFYDATATNLDFSDGTGSARKINAWCSKQTNGMIPKIMDTTDPGMLAYLLNAMYFKSKWAEQFKKTDTEDEPFKNEAGVKKTVRMMKIDKEFQYTENEVFQAVRLPYGNGSFAMTVLLPRPDRLVAEVVKELRKTDDWLAFSRKMIPCDVDLWLPRFETRSSIPLKDILSEMGMPTAFGGSADFKAMSDYAARLSYVQQDAAIKVDEEGTEAAVVSHAGMEKASAPMPGDHVVFHADHPFLYLITESSTGAILFAGRYGF